MVLLFVAGAAAQVPAPELRQWTSRDGSYQVEAEWIDETDDSVVLRRADGKRIEVPKAKLSDQDLEYLSQRTAPATASRTAAENAGPTYDKPTTIRASMGIEVTASGGAFRSLVATFPLPIDWPEQSVKILSQDMSGHIKSVRQRVLDDGVRQMEVRIPQLADGETARAVVEIEVQRMAIQAPADPTTFVVPKRVPKDVQRYLSASPSIESDHPEIRNIAAQFAIDPEQPAWPQVERIYQWVREHINHHEGTMPLHGALAALRSQKGDCEEYTSLFVAICRANGVAARSVWVPGHAYAEFYLLDGAGNGHWFPCESLGVYSFGHIQTRKIIMQKGDSFKMSQKKDRQRYVTETLSGLPAGRGGGTPSIRPVRMIDGQPSPFVGSTTAGK